MDDSEDSKEEVSMDEWIEENSERASKGMVKMENQESPVVKFEYKGSISLISRSLKFISVRQDSLKIVARLRFEGVSICTDEPFEVVQKKLVEKFDADLCSTETKLEHKETPAVESEYQTSVIENLQKRWHKLKDKKPRMFARVLVRCGSSKPRFAKLVNEGNSWESTDQTWVVSGGDEWTYYKDSSIENDTQIMLKALLGNYDNEELITFLEYLETKDSK